MGSALRLKVFLAGRFALESDGAPIAEARLPARQGRLLFAYLVAEQGRPVPRDELAEALWGDTPPPTWEKALAVVASKVRGALTEGGLDGSAVLTGAFGCYRLELADGAWVDVIAAAEAADEAEHALASGDLERARAAGELAASTAAQMFLPGEDGAWVEQKRRELADVRSRALTALSDACLGAGDPAEAAKWAEQAIELTPFRESGYRRLMEAHVAAGDRAEALRVYEHLRRLLTDELGTYPSPETETIYRGLLASERAIPADAASLPRAPAAAPPTNLPVPRTLLVGRAREIAEISERIRRADVRLLTLTGPGGAGKTRLALEAAAKLVDDFPGGVFLVALGPLTDSGLVVSTIAETFGVEESGVTPIAETLAAALANRGVLLVLDNFEHVLDAAPALGDLLASAPALKLLVTSRIPLHLAAEHEYPVPPLTVPDPARLPEFSSLSRYEAVALFVERARAVKADFEVTAANAPALAELCVRLDGLPLAIELAAARAKLLSPQALVARQEHRLDLLTAGPRDGPARQQTLRATIDWSHGLLEPDGQALFARLSVFSGGCALDAAEAICGGDVLNGLAALVDASLLRQEEQSDGEPRFTMLETLRVYALERLEARQDAVETRRRHAGFFAAIDERVPVDMRFGEPDWFSLDRDVDNFRAALAELIALDEPAALVRLVGALRFMWFTRGHLREGARWADEAVERATALPLRLQAQAWEYAASFALWRRDDERAAVLFQRALDAYRLSEVSDPYGESWSLHELGWLATRRGDLDLADSYHQRATTMFRELEAWKLLATGIHNHGLVRLQQGDYAGARGMLEESLALSRTIGSEESVGNAFADLALLALYERKYEEAAPLFKTSLDYALRIGWRANISFCLRGIAGLVARRGDLEAAARLLGAAETIDESTGYPLERYELDAFGELLVPLIRRADEPGLTNARDAGRAMTEPDAATYALALITS